MNDALLMLTVFGILFTPFFLFLAALRFIPQEKRQIRIKVPSGLKIDPWVANVLELVAGLF